MALWFRSCGLAIVLFAATLSSAGAQSVEQSAVRTRILALEHAWNQAEAFGDLKALDDLFDNAMIYVDFDGTLLTKAEFLSRVKSQHVEQVTTQSMTVAVFDLTAVVTGTYLAREIKHGREVIRRGRFIDTWVYKNQTWVCVAAQDTPLLR